MASTIVETALSLQGIPYTWGGQDPSTGFDCSGFVEYVFRVSGLSLPRTADVQFQCGYDIPKNLLAPGDLVFFQTYEPGPSHVGIYIGDSKFVDSTDGGVKVESLESDYRRSCYYGAKRVITPDLAASIIGAQ